MVGETVWFVPADGPPEAFLDALRVALSRRGMTIASARAYDFVALHRRTRVYVRAGPHGRGVELWLKVKAPLFGRGDQALQEVQAACQEVQAALAERAAQFAGKK
ncbi:MAG TPA: hypothetical protein VM681_00700 [Candidatus Thermoplasmatota archaeon]|nr:hypothetical protein [Candidatus Thermoplasmatota archaeon]